MCFFGQFWQKLRLSVWFRKCGAYFCAMFRISLNKNKVAALLASLLLSAVASAQILTHEDSISAGLNIKGNRATAISGYGEAFYSQDFRNNIAEAQLRRAVLFIGHRFNNRITFFSEMELENAVVTGEQKGEISMEQCFVKFDISRSSYINAGFFTPRIGVMNENHLPNTFYGNERPVLETMIIPSTWREIGLSINGSVPFMPGLNYSLGLFNGLNAQGFSLEEGISGGRYEGFKASARNKAVTGSLLYYVGPYRFQVAGYVGGSNGLDDNTSSFIGLSTGMFGAPVYLGDINVQYRQNGWFGKAQATQISIPDANLINTAYSNNTPEKMIGALGEIGYDFLHRRYKGERQFHAFTRYEYIDMNAAIPETGIKNPYFTQQHIFFGLSYLPVRGVVIKADYHYVMNGAFNTDLVINPPPYQLPYYQNRSFLKLGLAYSF